jgi:hypothetical protein
MADEPVGQETPEQADAAQGDSEITPERVRSNLFAYPMTAIGGALIGAGILAFFVMLGIDLLGGGDNPYRAIITWIGIPFIITIGAVLTLIGAVRVARQARKRGEKMRFFLRIEPSNPKYMRNLWLFLGSTAVLLILVVYSGIRAYEATESVSFCGEACHEVMGPQNTTYLASAHARVPCVECHIGPGRSFWVRSKIDGLRQVWRTLTNSFERPIPTPVKALRPAQETCEHCHWPEQFYGQQLTNRTYYRTDEANSPWTISLLVNVGGGNPRTGALEGIHWHMVSGNTIEYIATDRERQDIPWVRVTDLDGNVTVYSDPESQIAPETPDIEVRTFDCIDCHNRPSHHFLPPATAMNLEMTRGAISPSLPFIRKTGLDLLNAQYETREEANAAIVAGIDEFYRTQYPDRYDALKPTIDQAAQTLLTIYNDNFFPEMKTDYRERIDDLSHFVNEGCFRCHGTDLQSESGETITAECESCHAVVAQGPSADLADLEQDINGLEFQHPVEIGGVWQNIQCTQCHTPAQGY